MAELIPPNITETLASPTSRSEKLFNLRVQVNEEVRRATEERIRTNPVKTKLEEDFGIYLEELEPAVRNAVIQMHELGYTTTYAGFYGNDNRQAIRGEFRLDNETKQALKGTEVNTQEFKEFDIDCTALEFYPDTADQAAIETKWEQVVSMLPPAGHPATPSKMLEIFHQRVAQQLGENK